MAPREDDLATRPAPRAPQAAPEAGDSASKNSAAAAGTSRGSSENETLSTAPSLAGKDPGAVIPRGRLLGRYVVLKELGAGAMGRVYEAFDPKLDRRIALKVLRLDPSMGTVRERAESRLLQEAQALAKLRHPNVVAVHDVENTPDGLVVTMDYIAGTTLRGWLAASKRSWPEVVAVMRGAAEGLAAAHRVGLVHRDFKPDNVMVDANDAARVVDFGLAQAFDPAGSAERTADDSPTAGVSRPSGGTRDNPTMAHAGTPAYMAPEQHRAQSTGPAADQFSYCVTLYEALWGLRPFPGQDLASLTYAVLGGKYIPPPRSTDVPRWIRDAVVRGLATDPRERFDSMDALLAELARDPAATRRRVAMGGLVAASVAVGTWGWVGRHEPTPCKTGPDRIAQTWNDAKRERVDLALRATNTPYAPTTAETVVGSLDLYANSWATMFDEICTATKIEGHQSERMFDMRIACLRRREQSLAAATDVLANADEVVAQRARRIVGGLAPLGACADLEALHQSVPPPEDPERRRRVEGLRATLSVAEALEHAGKFEDAAKQLVDIEDAIPATKYLPLTAEYLRLVGLVADDRGDSKSAEETLTDAAWTAQRAGHDYEMARSMTDLVYVIGNHLARTDDALLWGKHADAAVERVGDEFLRARLANHIGMTLDVGARYEEALQWLGDAVDKFEQLGGPDDWNTISARSAYASVLDSLGRYDESSLEQSAIVEATRRTLGPDHPDYAVTLTNQALFQIQVGQVVEAIASLETARKIFERVHGKQHPHLGAVWTNLAVAHHTRDDFSATRDAMERALEINEATLGPEHPDVANTIGNLGSVSFQLGDFPAAEAYTRRSLKLLTAAIGSDHPDVGGAWLQLGVVLRAQGRLKAALEAGERAAAILRAKLPSDHVELGRACVALAQTHADGEQWPQSQRYAQEALAIFEAHPAVMPWNRGKARFLEAAARWAQGEREAVVEVVRKARDEIGSEDTAAGEAIEAWLAEH